MSVAAMESSSQTLDWDLDPHSFGSAPELPMAVLVVDIAVEVAAADIPCSWVVAVIIIDLEKQSWQPLSCAILPWLYDSHVPQSDA